MTTKTAPPSELAGFMALCQDRVRAALERWLPPQDTEPRQLHEAMRYATLAGGGKYIRPLLVYATGQALGIGLHRLDGPACAVELIHAYSLVHDDLPAMDDDTLRRGRPTCHVAYGEALAILAGDALQSLAFHVLASDPAVDVPPARRLKMIDTLAVAGGSLGMAGGQAIDLAAVGREASLSELENMHLRKTGALIRASVLLGALCRETAGEEILHPLGHYARCVGLAFQIHDDVLDVEGDAASLGKTPGTDRDRNKPTYTSLLGVDDARAMARALHQEAVRHLAALRGALHGTAAAQIDMLQAISAYVIERGH